MHASVRRGLGCLGVVLVCFLAGCYDVTQGNGVTVYRFAFWVPFLAGAAALPAVPVGLFFIVRKEKWWGGAVTIVIGLLVLIAVLPGLIMDRVLVDNAHFYSTHGFWWSKQTHDVQFSQVQSVLVTQEETRGRRGRITYNYFFNVTYKGGRQEKIPLGDLMREALPLIRSKFSENRIPVTQNFD